MTSTAPARCPSCWLSHWTLRVITTLSHYLTLTSLINSYIRVTSQANSRVKSYLKKPEENSIECPYLSEICHLCSSPYNSHGEWDTGSETRGVRHGEWDLSWWRPHGYCLYSELSTLYTPLPGGHINNLTGHHSLHSLDEVNSTRSESGPSASNGNFYHSHPSLYLCILF